MRDIAELASEIIAREGGYVDDPDDPGGATNFGVTIHTMRRLGMDLTRDGVVDALDVRALTRGQAVTLFLGHYYERPGIARLPESLQASVFDMYVNAGGHAVKILQRLLAQFGEPVKVDGAIGPETLGAAARVMEKAPDHFVDAYGIARRNYYYKLADARAASRKYARRSDGGKGGWITRAEEFIAKRFHFSLSDHKARVSAWA